jgi:hypothetical protein
MQARRNLGAKASRGSRCEPTTCHHRSPYKMPKMSPSSNIDTAINAQDRAKSLDSSSHLQEDVCNRSLPCQRSRSRLSVFLLCPKSQFKRTGSTQGRKHSGAHDIQRRSLEQDSRKMRKREEISSVVIALAQSPLFSVRHCSSAMMSIGPLESRPGSLCKG